MAFWDYDADHNNQYSSSVVIMDYAKIDNGIAVRIKTVEESDPIALPKLLAHGYVPLDENHTVDLELFPCYAFGERPAHAEQGWDRPTYRPWEKT